MTDLKPCPFCGSPAKMISPMGCWVSKEVGYGPRGSRIVCPAPGDKCCAMSPAFHGPDQDAEAIAAWNTRADHPTAVDAALGGDLPPELDAPCPDEAKAALRRGVVLAETVRREREVTLGGYEAAPSAAECAQIQTPKSEGEGQEPSRAQIEAVFDLLDSGQLGEEFNARDVCLAVLNAASLSKGEQEEAVAWQARIKPDGEWFNLDHEYVDGRSTDTALEVRALGVIGAAPPSLPGREELRSILDELLDIDLSAHHRIDTAAVRLAAILAEEIAQAVVSRADRLASLVGRGEAT